MQAHGIGQWSAGTGGRRVILIDGVSRIDAERLL